MTSPDESHLDDLVQLIISKIPTCDSSLNHKQSSYYKYINLPRNCLVLVNYFDYAKREPIDETLPVAKSMYKRNPPITAQDFVILFDHHYPGIRSILNKKFLFSCNDIIKFLVSDGSIDIEGEETSYRCITFYTRYSNVSEYEENVSKVICHMLGWLKKKDDEEYLVQRTSESHCLTIDYYIGVRTKGSSTIPLPCLIVSFKMNRDCTSLCGMDQGVVYDGTNIFACEKTIFFLNHGVVDSSTADVIHMIKSGYSFIDLNQIKRNCSITHIKQTSHRAYKLSFDDDEVGAANVRYTVSVFPEDISFALNNVKACISTEFSYISFSPLLINDIPSSDDLHFDLAAPIIESSLKQFVNTTNKLASSHKLGKDFLGTVEGKALMNRFVNPLDEFLIDESEDNESSPLSNMLKKMSFVIINSFLQKTFDNILSLGKALGLDGNPNCTRIGRIILLHYIHHPSMSITSLLTKLESKVDKVKLS